MRLQELFKKHVKNVVLMFAVLFLLVLFFTVIARAESYYVCNFCYDYEQDGKLLCETLTASSLEESQQLVMQRANLLATTSFKSKLGKIMIDCTYPDKLEQGYKGYKAAISFKK